MPQSTFELVLPALHAGQRRVVSQAGRYNVCCMGRRFGKSTLGLDRAAYPMLDGYKVGWFAPKYKYLQEAWRDAVKLFKPITVHKSEQEKRIEILGGGVLEFWSLEDPDAGRSRKYRRVIIDEAGFARLLSESWGSAIRPTLSDDEGDAWFLGTPKAGSFFKTLFLRGMNPADIRDGWRSWRLPTSANPYIKASEIEAAKKELLDWEFDQEYLAIFVASSGAVFQLRQSHVWSPRPLEVYSGNFVAGIDFGRVNDRTCIVVMDRDRHSVVDIDYFTRESLSYQKKRLAKMVKKWKVKHVLAEENSFGIAVIEDLQSAGLPIQPFNTNSVSKIQLIQSLQLALDKNEIKIVGDNTLITELQEYQKIVSERTGRVGYGSPRDKPDVHDDTVIGLALANQACYNAPLVHR